ncbi:MAG: hypothetical protein ACK53W_12555 [Gemmatimonadota bacterium]
MTAIIAASGLMALVIHRAPSVAQAWAVARGRGETERERDQAKEIEHLKAIVARHEDRFRLIQHLWEERRMTLQQMTEQVQCLTPDCRFEETVALIRNFIAQEEAIIQQLTDRHPPP